MKTASDLPAVVLAAILGVSLFVIALLFVF